MRRLLPLLLLIGCAPPGGEEPGGPDALGEELSSPDAHREDLSSSDAPRGEGLPGPDVLSWPDPAGVGARLVFEAEPAGFFDQPFPFDLRRSHTGAPDLTGFPNPFGLPVVDTYVDAIGPVLDGFSPAGTAYLRFDGPLDLDAFPDPAASASADSPVLLVCVDPACPAYGVPVPLELAYYGATPPAEGYYLQPFLLMAKPLQGFPLREGERYALLVRRSLGDGAGRLLGPSEVLERVLRGEAVAAAEEAVAAALAPGLDWLDSAGIDRGEVAALTVFTTARPTLEMRRAADFVRTQLPAPALAGPVEQLKVADNHVLWKGTYTAPNFQRGEPPYDAGGGFVFDPDGNPVVQWQETITFALSVPEGPVPKGGWPLVMYSHGTGGSYLSLKGSTATRFADLGIAVIGIDQPFHGER
ncbi:MAG: hypothetical protein FJ098_09460, partial [Deltaproteobacteria bacterium]|nr:hypothetical protein [Deltaproteobacteria bacterium]